MRRFPLQIDVAGAYTCQPEPDIPIPIDGYVEPPRNARQFIDEERRLADTKISAIVNNDGLKSDGSWIRAVSNPLVFGVARSRMTGCRLVTPQSELRRPLRDTVPSNFFNVAREYAADSRS